MKSTTRLLGAVSALILAGCGAAEQSNEAPQQVSAEPVETATPEETVTDAQDAEAAEPSDVRQADSHVHGAANLAIVLDGTALTIELETPLFNLLGFEHAAETEIEAATIEAAETTLTQPALLFAINEAAGCTPSTETIDVHLIKSAHDDEHTHDEHEEHDDEHAYEAEDDHHDEHEGDEEHEEHPNHKDALLQYDYECAEPEALTDIDVTLLNEFTNMTDLDVVYLAEDRQDLFELGQTSTKINLRK